MVMDKQWVKS